MKMASSVGVGDFLQFQKHRAGKVVTKAQKQIILNVYNEVCRGEPKRSKSEVVSETCKLTGVSTGTVYKIVSEAEKGRLLSPQTSRPGAVGKRTRMRIYDEFTRSAIRRKVHDFVRRNEIPIVRKLLTAVREDPALPNFSRVTMQQMMKTLNFVYFRRKRVSLPVEREDIVLWRRRYLRTMRTYRQTQSRSVYYVDETWINVELEQPSSGAGSSSASRQRIVIVHAGSERGFVPGADLFFRTPKTSIYDDVVDSKYFQKWFVHQLIPNIEPNSVIIMDSVSYHCAKAETIPDRDAPKSQMQSWLTSKEIAWNPNMLKCELLQEIERVRGKYDVNRIDYEAGVNGHTVLIQPPNHSDLNPFELVWRDVKSFIAANNRLSTWKDLPHLMTKAIESVTVEKWAEFVGQTRREEDKLWELDEVIETFVENVQCDETAADEERTNAEEDVELYYETCELDFDNE